MLMHDVQVLSFLLATGLIGQLTSETFTLLMKLQNKMASIVKSMGNIEHEVYPSNCHLWVYYISHDACNFWV